MCGCHLYNTAIEDKTVQHTQGNHKNIYIWRFKTLPIEALHVEATNTSQTRTKKKCGSYTKWKITPHIQSPWVF